MNHNLIQQVNVKVHKVLDMKENIFCELQPFIDNIWLKMTKIGSFDHFLILTSQNQMV